MDSEIANYHSEPNLVLMDDEYYCATSLRRLLSGSTANKRRWLMRVKASRQQRAALQISQTSITKYFAPLQAQSPITTKISTQPTLTERNKNTQQIMAQFLKERAPSRPMLARNTSTQQLLTNKFLKERASNHTTSIPPSPPPSTQEIG